MNAEDREPRIVGGKLQIGALVRFVPAACQVCEAGMTPHVLSEVIGTVTEIHEAHRWYRVAYYMGADLDCIGYECFKIKSKSKEGGHHENNCDSEPEGRRGQDGHVRQHGGDPRR